MKETDYVYKFVSYLKKNLAKGYSIDSLKIALINQGYSRIAIEKAIEIVNNDLAKKIPPMKERPRIKYELIDEDNKVIHVSLKKPWWKRFLKF